jgi:site-specific DNA-methyltransferase (adenine-specific)
MRSTGITAKQINEITDSFMGSHYLTDREQPAVPTEEMFSKLRPHLPTVPDDIEELVRMRTVEAENFKRREVIGRHGDKTAPGGFGEHRFSFTSKNITAPNTDLAKEWHGWGTALKPAYEPAILARKPLWGTVADNVAQWGTGGLNIDGCRVAYEGKAPTGSGNESNVVVYGHYKGTGGNETSPLGRWPANVILDEEAAAALDAQSGVGGASRFFYTAKASRSEREAGLDGVEVQRANHHPTVKPIALMRYMIRLVAPRGAVVLDPFMGSGSTGCAAMVEGMQFVGIDITPEYVDIARRRLAWWSSSSPLDNMATMELHEENEA